MEAEDGEREGVDSGLHYDLSVVPIQVSALDAVSTKTKKKCQTGFIPETYIKTVKISL